MVFLDIRGPSKNGVDLSPLVGLERTHSAVLGLVTKIGTILRQSDIPSRRNAEISKINF